MYDFFFLLLRAVVRWCVCVCACVRLLYMINKQSILTQEFPSNPLYILYITRAAPLTTLQVTPAFAGRSYNHPQLLCIPFYEFHMYFIPPKMFEAYIDLTFNVLTCDWLQCLLCVGVKNMHFATSETLYMTNTVKGRKFKLDILHYYYHRIFLFIWNHFLTVNIFLVSPLWRRRETPSFPAQCGV